MLNVNIKPFYFSLLRPHSSPTSPERNENTDAGSMPSHLISFDPPIFSPSPRPFAYKTHPPLTQHVNGYHDSRGYESEGHTSHGERDEIAGVGRDQLDGTLGDQPDHTVMQSAKPVKCQRSNGLIIDIR